MIAVPSVPNRKIKSWNSETFVGKRFKGDVPAVPAVPGKNINIYTRKKILKNLRLNIFPHVRAFYLGTLGTLGTARTDKGLTVPDLTFFGWHSLGTVKIMVFK